MASSSLKFVHISFLQTGAKSKIHTRTANSVDPDETARYEPSHLDLYYLQRYLCWAKCGGRGVVLIGVNRGTN